MQLRTRLMMSAWTLYRYPEYALPSVQDRAADHARCTDVPGHLSEGPETHEGPIYGSPVHPRHSGPQLEPCR